MASTKFIAGIGFILLLLIAEQATADEMIPKNKFDKGSESFGLQVGMGFTADIPEGNRPDLSFIFFFPNYQHSLTGLIGDSWYRGTLNWHVEAGFASILNKDGEYLFGISPLILQYKFADPKKSWAPNILVGAGFSYTNWDEDDVAPRELGGEFQFLLHAGAGLEFFTNWGDYSLNYRLFHISNAGIKDPNIGLNAHIISLGFQF